MPAWHESRRLLAPIFICTASASGAAATRLALTAVGTASDHPTRSGLAAVETIAMGAELALSAVNERGLGIAGRALEHGRPGRLLRAARALTAGGLVAPAARPARRPAGDHLPSVVFLVAALAYRLGWVAAGRTSALDHEAVAAVARVSRPRSRRS